MNQRFQNEERNNVRTQYGDDELFMAIDKIGIILETDMPVFDMCPEEMYVEVMRVLTIIADDGEGYKEEERLWHMLYNEYRRFDRSVSEDEIKEAVAIVFLFAVVALDSSSYGFYRYRMTERLTQVTKVQSCERWSEICEKIFEAYVPDGWFDRFLEHGFETELNQKKNTPIDSTDNSFYSFVTSDLHRDEIIYKIKVYLKGKKPNQAKDVMKPLRAAQEAGLIRRITYNEMNAIFPEYCPKIKSSVSKYTNEGEYRYIDQAYKDMVEEFKAMKERFKNEEDNGEKNMQCNRDESCPLSDGIEIGR